METSMPALLIRHKVTDYATWKPVFDEHETTRRAHGCQGGRLFRNAADPNETLILLTWDDLERARLFAQSDDLRDAMRQAGVADEPDLWFLEEAPD
jgi:quinol monooxygenase YgiN